MTSLSPLVQVMARLRDPASGCPWELAQDFASIAPYTIEEAYEVADAIERGDMAALKDELGDLLLQVVFHARMAEETGDFAIADVIAGIVDKMERRHPHIFGDLAVTGAQDVAGNWEAIKAAERAQHEDRSALAGVAKALPALLRAEKIQKRAARVGFDWPNAAGPRAKIGEELDELDRAATPAEMEDELGDLLFAVVNLARHRGIDPEAALRSATAKFERRFRAVEAAADGPLTECDPVELDRLWNAAKAVTGG